jgi:hypothetical protein
MLNLAGNSLYGKMPDLSGLNQLSELKLSPNGNLTGITALPIKSFKTPSPTPQVQNQLSNGTISPVIIALIVISLAFVIASVLALILYKCIFKAKFAARRREKRHDEPSYLVSAENNTDQKSQDASRTSIAMPIFMMNILGMKKLRITKQISKGGFGYVYLGVYGGKRVAVKQLIKPKSKVDKLRLSGMFGMFSS